MKGLRRNLSLSKGRLRQNSSDEKFPLPELGFRYSFLRKGLRWCGHTYFSGVFQCVLGIIYYACGLGQFVCGIKYMLELPIFHFGSNIWTGSWNILSGAIMASLGSCCGPLSPFKARGIALLSALIALLNAVNLIILEAGEWRAFLSEEDRAYIRDRHLDTHLSIAYYATTICTVLSLVSSLLGMVHALVFIKAKKETSIRELFSSNLIDSTNSKFSTLTDLTTDMVQNHCGGSLNLKTPAGPQPHPSWVYRHSSSSNSVTSNSGVKRSISYLGMGKSLSQLESSSGDIYASHHHAHHQGTLRKASGGIQSISENALGELQSTNFPKYKPQKTAQIRRHQSMYINPSTVFEHGGTLLSPGHPKISMSKRASNLKRSATSAGVYPSSHYAAYRKFKENYRKLQGGDSLFCEFQAGKSFDLPDPTKLSSYSNRSNDLWADGTPACIMMTTYDDEDEDDREPPSSDDSCRDNIRYQAINGLLQDSRHQRRNQETMIHHRYASLENLLKSTGNKMSSPLGMVRYNSTGSISSTGSERKASSLFPSKTVEDQEALRRSQMTQTPTSIYSLESKHAQNSSIVDSEDDRVVQTIYDVPRKRNASIKKSNSRVSSSGKLRLRVESFKESAVHTSSTETQTDGNYTGQFGGSASQGKKQHPSSSNQVPPKPIRKYKPNGNPPATISHSERSTSPDNSSTSGYSSPSASGASKETPNTEEITVIQIVPTEPPAPGAKRLSSFHRELPRIATNGTLQRPLLLLKQRKQDQGALLSEYGSYTTLPRRSETRRGIPLPPVPELDRSDHERSISPSPRRLDKSKSLDSSSSRDYNIEEKLKVLLHLMNQNDQLCNQKSDILSEKGPSSGNKDDAVEYLAQLESVARRLKDHYLHKGPRS